MPTPVMPVKIYRTSVAGRQPNPADINYGEFALNFTDPALFIKDSNNNIQNLAAPKSVWARAFAFMGS